MVNFWGSWCAPVPGRGRRTWRRPTRRPRARGVAFVGVNSQDDRDAAKAFDAAGSPTRASTTRTAGWRWRSTSPQISTPATLILDRQGRIAAALRRSTTAAELQPLVERMAAGGRPADGRDASRTRPSSGPLLLAIAAAALAGLVSFLSPCVLPLVPGYLSYVTGLAGADLDAALSVPPGGPGRHADHGRGAARRGGEGPGTGRHRPVRRSASRRSSRCSATLVANIGLALKSHERLLNVVLGVLVIVLGLGFLGLIPGLQREIRISGCRPPGCSGRRSSGRCSRCPGCRARARPSARCSAWPRPAGRPTGRWSSRSRTASGWVCRSCVFGLFFRKLLGVFAAVRRNSRWVTRIGGVLLILVGLALVTGGWNEFPDLAADDLQLRRGDAAVTAVEQRPAPPAAPPPRRAQPRCGRCCATRGGSSPACVRRWCCCSCSRWRPFPARCCRSAAVNPATSTRYFAAAPEAGADAGPARRVRRVRVGLVRRDLPAAVHVAGGLRGAAAASTTCGRCGRPPPDAPRRLDRLPQHAYTDPRPATRRRRRGRRRRAAAPPLPDRGPRQPDGGGPSRPRRATSRRPATCCSTSPCSRCWSAWASGTGTAGTATGCWWPAPTAGSATRSRSTTTRRSGPGWTRATCPTSASG